MSTINTHTQENSFVIKTFFNMQGFNLLQVDEIEFILQNEYKSFLGGNGKRYGYVNGKRTGNSYVTLPFWKVDEKRLVDSIAKKLNLRKIYRGPRGGTSTTLREDAHAVSLYYKLKNWKNYYENENVST
jgi:hypothetical protein